MTEVNTQRLEIIAKLPRDNPDQPGHNLSSLKTPDLSLHGKSDGKESSIELDDTIAILLLSPRILNRLEDNGISTVRDLVSRGESDLQTLKWVGPTSLSQIKLALKKRGLSLKSVQQ